MNIVYSAKASGEGGRELKFTLCGSHMPMWAVTLKEIVVSNLHESTIKSILVPLTRHELTLNSYSSGD